MRTSIRTATNLYLDFADPQPDMIHPLDIIVGLSNENRYCGQTVVPYSVAQHSVHVCDFLPPHLRLEGLLHDATEAYIKDIPSPLKHLLPDYRLIEKRLDRVIRFKFGLPEEHTPEVKDVDTRIRVNETRDLFRNEHEEVDKWGVALPDLIIRAWDTNIVRHTFYRRFLNYTDRGFSHAR